MGCKRKEPAGVQAHHEVKDHLTFEEIIDRK